MRRMSDVEYSVEESSKTLKKRTPKANIGEDDDTDQKRVGLTRAASLSGFRRGTTLPGGSEYADQWQKKPSMQGTTRIDFIGSQVDFCGKENEGKLSATRANDSRLLPETISNLGEYLQGKHSRTPTLELKTSQSQIMRSKSFLKLDLTTSNRSIAKRPSSIDGRCPIDLSSKRKSLVKLEQHRGDQDLPYLLNHMGLLDSQSSRSMISLKKATLASLQKSWFGYKRVGGSKTMDLEPNLVKFDRYYQDKLSIGQYTLDKLNKNHTSESKGYKRINFFSSRFDGTIVTNES